MRRYLILILFFSNFIYSQSYKGRGYKNSNKVQENFYKGSIKGVLTDIKKNEPLAFANIALIKSQNNQIIEGTISNEKGQFILQDIPSGKYIIEFSYLGFKKQSREIVLTKKELVQNIGTVTMEQDSELLSEITIEEKKAIYEAKIDKVVYNAENDINQGLNDATDVLRKAPLLSVDFDGNVELRGSSNIKFLLNGKSSSFLQGDLGSALSMITAEEIKSVEIITSPGAKYDGEGDAGIVNIITKKKLIDGYQASIDGSFGTRINKNGYNLKIGKGKFSMSARGGVNYSWPRNGSTEFIRKDYNTELDTNLLENNGASRSQWVGYRGGLDVYYDINPYQSISSDINFSGRYTPSVSTTDFKYSNFDNLSMTYITLSEDTSIVSDTNDTKRIEWNIDYIKTFDNEDQEFSMAFQIGAKIKDEDTEILDIDNDTLTTKNINDETNLEQTFKIDYVHPLNKHKIEIGSKIINRDQNIQYTTISDDASLIIPTEILLYNQRVYATYLSLNIDLGNNFNLISGLRNEKTDSYAEWNNSSRNPVKNSYNDILPNFVFSKQIARGKNAKISYNKRISRPGSRYVNTNINRSNDAQITVGNPNLKPSKTHQIEIGFNNFNRKFQNSYYIYFKYSEDIIEAFLDTIIGENSITTYKNIGESSRIGVNYYGSIRFKNIDLRGGFNISDYNTQDIRLADQSRSAIMYNYNFGTTIRLKNNWKAEGFGFGRSKSQSLQGYSTTFSMMSFGVKKDFKNKRGSLGIRIIEPFLKNGKKRFESYSKGDNFEQESIRDINFTSIGISFKYTFGKLNFKSNKSRKSIENTDVKEESQSEF